MPRIQRSKRKVQDSTSQQRGKTSRREHTTEQVNASSLSPSSPPRSPRITNTSNKVQTDTFMEACTTPNKSTPAGSESYVENKVNTDNDNSNNSDSNSDSDGDSDIDSDSDDDVDIDWETVELPKWHPPAQENNNEEDLGEQEEQHHYKDVHIIFEAPRAVLKKSKWEMAYQRQLRDWMHNSHVVLLVGHFLIRNEWCSRQDVQSVCLSVIPDYISSQNNRRHESEDQFSTSIKWLLAWWRDYFQVNSHGLITRSVESYSAIPQMSTDDRHLNEKLEAHVKRLGIHDTEEVIQDPIAFVNCLAEKSGSRDLSAQLFTALLRTLGIETRLVSSLQPLPYRIPPASNATKPADGDADQVGESSTNRSSKNTSKNDSKTRMLLTSSSSSSSAPAANPYQQKKAKPPTVWCEVWNPHQHQWISIDPVRQLYNKPAMMEPTLSDRQNVLSYVLAFEEQEEGRRKKRERIRCVVDVTRRYTTHLPKALASRERELTKRERQGGWRLWSDLFLAGLQPSELRDQTQSSSSSSTTTSVSAKKQRYRDEQEQLDQQQNDQRMPTSIQGLRNHPLYVLERHLKKFEVLYHPTMTDNEMAVGQFKGEKIYPRSCVQHIHTRETWIQQGRVVMEGQEPVKRVLARAVTLEKKRLQEEAKRQGEPLQTDCFGFWQTAPYRPPPVVNGKVPKNDYGRVDLFTADMLPEGAAHVEVDGIAKIARQLGIDYAEAVIDFEFVRGRSIPKVNGIVVAKENECIILEAWREHEHHQTNKALAKHETQVYNRWRKLILGAQINARVNQDYHKQSAESSSGTAASSNSNANNTAWDRFMKQRHDGNSTEMDTGVDQMEEDAGGFILDDGDDDDDDDIGGGFIPESDEDSDN